MRKCRPHIPAGATAAPLPRTLQPQLATLAKAPPQEGEWTFQIKYDGYRMMVRVGADVRLYSKQGHDWTSQLPLVRDAVLASALPEGWYDGELVACDDDGRPNFGKLQASLTLTRQKCLVLYLFDAPFAHGYDLRHVPLVERLGVLRALLPRDKAGSVRFAESLTGDPAAIFEAACAMRLEGVMCKRNDAPYVSRRSRSWLKWKCGYREKFVVVGYSGRKDGPIGSLFVASPNEAGNLVYCGKVESGYTDADRRELGVALRLVAAEACPLAEPPKGLRYVKWVKPLLHATVSFAERTDRGMLRHAVYKGIELAESNT